MCLVRRALGQRAMDHGRQEYHMMWRKDKRKTGTGMVRYTGRRGPRGGERPSSPRSRASSPCDPPTGRTSKRVRPENLPTTPLVRGLQVVKAAVRTPSAGPREQERRPRGDRPWPRQLVIRPVGMAGGWSQLTSQDESCPRHAASINLGFVDGLDGQGVSPLPWFRWWPCSIPACGSTIVYRVHSNLWS